ncbi:type 2 periplasmic-binding domain-containing protein [Porticoccus sp.]
MMRNDLVDVGFMSLDQAIAFQIDTGLELCIAQVLDYSNGADALIVRPGTNLKEGGKTINLGLNGTILSKYMLNRAEDNQILDKGNINIIFAENNIAELYVNGKIDAAITSEPQLSRLVSLGAAVVFSSADIPGEVVDVVVSKTSVSQSRTKALSFLRDRVWVAGLLYLNTKKTDERSKSNFHPNAVDVAYVDNLSGIKLLTGEQSQKILKNSLNGIVDNIFSHLVEMEEYSINQSPQLRACSSH